MCVLKVRIKFAKTGSLRYIGHLDFMRAVQKIIRRTDIKAAYTRGFSPHLILSFASPLGVGLESTGEYFDLELAYRDPFEMSKVDLARLNSIGLENDELPDAPPYSRILSSLNEQTPEGVRFLGVKRIEENNNKAMALVRAADYSVFLEKDAFAGSNVISLLDSFMQKEKIVVHKVTKKTESDVDIRPLIFDAAVVTENYSLFINDIKKLSVCSKSDADYEQLKLAAQSSERIQAEGYPIVIDMKLSAGSAANLKPETVIEAMCAFAGVEYDPFSFRILRREMYAEGGKTLLDEGLLF